MSWSNSSRSATRCPRLPSAAFALPAASDSITQTDASRNQRSTFGKITELTRAGNTNPPITLAQMIPTRISSLRARAVSNTCWGAWIDGKAISGTVIAGSRNT
ncbi:hypothetical protein D9M68_903730 [compost metagenome]